MSNHYAVTYSVSSVPAMLQQADFLFTLADEHQDNAHTLASCIVILLAATLDQGISTVLAQAATPNGLPDSDQPEAKKFEDLGNAASFRKRLFELPKLRTRGRHRLNEACPHVRVLQSLIRLRNKLMHIQEPPVRRQVGIAGASTQNHPVVVLRGSVPGTGAGEVPASTQNHPVIVLANPPITNAWLGVSIKEAREFRKAVDLYVDEVLFPPCGLVKPGKIVL